MTTIDLDQALLEGGIEWTHFFNGRLMTAEDLTREQRANGTAHQRLGRATGRGVAYGLWASRSPASTAAAQVLSISRGLAVNGCGQALLLGSDVDLRLAEPAETPSQARGVFGACQDIAPGVYLVNTGLYVLTVAPAAGSQGSAPTSGVASATAPCNAGVDIEGLQFSLRSLQVDASVLASGARLRNVVAHGCLGGVDPARVRFQLDPFGADEVGYGWLADPARVALSDLEVPLAVLHWDSSGVQFVDCWTARRRLVRPGASEHWRAAVTERRRAEGEATFLQFQDQLATIFADSTAHAVLRASDQFRYLPPAGLLPADATGDSRRFRIDRFFDGVVTRGPLHLSVREVEGLLEESFLHPPIEATSGEFVWLYEVAEASLFGASPAGATRQPWILFASGHLARRGTARFDLARYDASEYGPL